jgi:DNA-binding NarL/FixJ family response regulator
MAIAAKPRPTARFHCTAAACNISAGKRSPANGREETLVTETRTFIVADDHPLFRNALRQTIEPHFSGTIIEAATLKEAAAAIESAQEPDLVLFDLSMPGARGFSGLMYLRAQYPAVPVCVVSANEDPGTIRRSMSLGAAGFVPKSSAPARIREAIATILAGGTWTPPGLDLRNGWNGEDGLAERLRSLTPQQLRVLMMMAEGLLNKQIAHELGVSEATVKAHVSAVLQKLHVENRTKAVLAAGRFELGNWQAVAED